MFFDVLKSMKNLATADRMANTETSPLSIESFSYSWLINLKPSFESLGESFRSILEASDEAFFIEMDPRMPASKRFSRHAHDFDFDLPFSHKSPPATVFCADEIFSNGPLKPLFNPSKAGACASSSTAPGTSVLRKTASGSRLLPSSLRRCRSYSKQMLEKYLDFLKLVCLKVRGCRHNPKLRAARVGPSTGDSDSSIYEAVLHCKRSLGV
ncbi:hypothetical protein Nepgr_021471 [Nepenthes gracilis]|uniref:Membrane-associated kinase regulator 6 n=1 Tax=Nepenthes gracilis TaxID=150966 RepID=A0AAD3SYQ3_NEPGR|nr:hypothetical protein Nepgr_021471 [Nepenthes gracilis]